MNAFLKFWNLWTVTRFWWLWGAAVPIAAIVLLSFVRLAMDGTISADNILPWVLILLATASVMGGSYWLRAHNHPQLAALPVLILLVPTVVCVGGGLLFSLLYFIVFLFGHGRMN